LKADEEDKKDSNAVPASQRTPDMASRYSLKQLKLTKNFDGLTTAEAKMNFFHIGASRRMLLQKKLKPELRTKYTHHINRFLKTTSWVEKSRNTAERFIFEVACFTDFICIKTINRFIALLLGRPYTVKTLKRMAGYYRAFHEFQKLPELPPLDLLTMKTGLMYSTVNEMCQELFLLGFYKGKRRYFEDVFILHMVACRDLDVNSLLRMKYSDFNCMEDTATELANDGANRAASFTSVTNIQTQGYRFILPFWNEFYSNMIRTTKDSKGNWFFERYILEMSLRFGNARIKGGVIITDDCIFPSTDANQIHKRFTVSLSNRLGKKYSIKNFRALDNPDKSTDGKEILPFKLPNAAFGPEHFKHFKPDIKRQEYLALDCHWLCSCGSCWLEFKKPATQSI
jgi:hypothetical protein